MAPLGRLFVILGLTVRHRKIVESNVVANPARLRPLDLAVLNGSLANGSLHGKWRKRNNMVVREDEATCVGSEVAESATAR